LDGTAAVTPTYQTDPLARATAAQVNGAEPFDFTGEQPDADTWLV
jgi:hypothetical protein